MTVEQMRYCGESEAIIARALSVHPNTLRKHYGNELADGYANRRKEVIALIFESARKGSATAQKRIDEMGRVAGAAEAVDARATKAPTLGKKGEQQQAAERVVGKFAPPAGPKLVIDNR
jgi:hypothetical protein